MFTYSPNKDAAEDSEWTVSEWNNWAPRNYSFNQTGKQMRWHASIA